MDGRMDKDRQTNKDGKTGGEINKYINSCPLYKKAAQIFINRPNILFSQSEVNKRSPSGRDNAQSGNTVSAKHAPYCLLLVLGRFPPNWASFDHVRPRKKNALDWFFQFKTLRILGWYLFIYFYLFLFIFIFIFLRCSWAGDPQTNLANLTCLGYGRVWFGAFKYHLAKTNIYI